MKEKPPSPILDNRRSTSTLAGYLREHLKDAEKFRIVSAYFSVFGFEALADKLESASLKEVRFLFGEPESASEVISGERPTRAFNLTEVGLSLEEGVLHQRPLAERCAQWVQQDSVEVRKVAQSNFLHGKMYHLESKQGGAATVGSSNFTLRGMGESKNPNIEINLAVSDEPTRAGLACWFDELWDEEKLTTDAKQEVLAALARLHEERAPEFIYYKTLFGLFQNQIEAYEHEDGEPGATGLYNSKIWKALYEFQCDGSKSVINRLLTHNGCILADSVGLGKTYTALAVIKYFELRNKQVLVLCPKKLEQNWRTYQASAFDENNPFAEDKFSYALLAHTDLTRDKGKSGNIDLAKFNWGAYDLVVIDESHNFRNDSKSRRNEEGEVVRRSRYEKLLEDVIKSGPHTKVLMLSATPVNTSLIDLRSQIYLITEKRDHLFAESLGVGNIKQVITAAQKKFQAWEADGTKKQKDKLLAALGGDFMNLLSGLTIARSRNQIKKFYSEFIKEKGDFPRREKPQNEYPHTDLHEELSYKELNTDLSSLQFHIYRPSHYIKDEQAKKRLETEKETFNFNQRDREKFLVAMMHVNFLKRLESSAHACKLTLERTLEKINTQIQKIDKFKQIQQDSQIEAIDQTEDQEEDEDFVVSRKAMAPYHLHELDVEKWRADMQKDQSALRDALVKIQKIEPERDGKLALLKEKIREKAGQRSRKLLVFTAFKDTAEYLYEQLKPLADELGINAALVAGDVATATCCNNNFTAILNHFAPKARRQDGIVPDEQVDLLIATDCISEGQNLQDCDTVLNYDIHWNPVRLIQRFGRIDRLGTEHKSVYMINYWPTSDMDFYLKLEHRVRARMALADVAATGDDDSLNEAEIKQAMVAEINFRDQQLLQMRDEVIDLDDREDAISMSDFTLDYFITQLLRYLQANRTQLEQAPPGIYAVTNAADGQTKSPLQDGAIFFFKQINPGENTVKNPLHPFYFVHVEKGKVRYGYTKLRTILHIFESLAVGKEKPLLKLCDSFSAEIETEQGRQFYDGLAKLAVDDIAEAFSKQSAEALRRDAGRGGLLAKKSDRPSIANLGLLTWLVIKNEGAIKK